MATLALAGWHRAADLPHQPAIQIAAGTRHSPRIVRDRLRDCGALVRAHHVAQSVQLVQLISWVARNEVVPRSPIGERGTMILRIIQSKRRSEQILYCIDHMKRGVSASLGNRRDPDAHLLWSTGAFSSVCRCLYCVLFLADEHQIQQQQHTTDYSQL